MVAYLNGFPSRLAPKRRVWNAGKCCHVPASRGVDHAGYIIGFIRHAVKNHKVDSSRIYLMGHSNGAMMAYRFACQHPKAIAAIAVTSGPLMYEDCHPRGLKGVLHIHGKDDKRVPVAGKRNSRMKQFAFSSVAYTKRAMARAGVPVKITLLDGIGHNLDDIDDRINIAKTAWKFFRDKRR